MPLTPINNSDIGSQARIKINAIATKADTVETDLNTLETTVAGLSAASATDLSYTASATNGIVASSTGTDATLPVADGTNAGLMAPAQFTKLAGVATAATANATDAQLRDRTTHTGEQAISTVTGLQTALDSKAPALSRTITSRITSDFCGGTITGTELVSAVVGTGGAQVSSPSTANHKGVWGIRSGTAPDSGWRVMTQADGLFVTGGEVFEGIFQVATTFEATTQARMGYFNGTTAAVSNDSMNYRVAHNGTNPTITPVCRNNGTETTGTTINIVAGTWYSVQITLNDAGNSCVFVLRSEAGATLNTQTITTNIPLNRTIGAGYLATDSTISGGVNRFFFDRVDIYNNKPMTR